MYKFRAEKARHIFAKLSCTYILIPFNLPDVGLKTRKKKYITLRNSFWPRNTWVDLGECMCVCVCRGSMCHAIHECIKILFPLHQLIKINMIYLSGFMSMLLWMKTKQNRQNHKTVGTPSIPENNWIFLHLGLLSSLVHRLSEIHISERDTEKHHVDPIYALLAITVFPFSFLGAFSK